jgi:hypothetical protein
MTGEGDLRVTRDVEKVGAAKVSVAVGFPGPDPGCVDFTLERRFKPTVRVELQLAVDVLEHAAHPRDHHVAGPELCPGMPRLEDPGRHQRDLETGGGWAGLIAGSITALRSEGACGESGSTETD